MSSEQDRRFNSGFVRFLPQLDEKHPDSRGTILIHGPAADSASYVEIAKAFDFKVLTSDSSAEFIEGAGLGGHILCVLFITEEIETDVLDHYITLCEASDPLYALQITTIQGDLPSINKKYQIFIHKNNIVPGNPAAERVDAATKELFNRAYKDDISDKLPEWMTQELIRHNKLGYTL